MRLVQLNHGDKFMLAQTEDSTIYRLEKTILSLSAHDQTGKQYDFPSDTHVVRITESGDAEIWR